MSKIYISLILLVSLCAFGCTRVYPTNPGSGEFLTKDVKSLSHVEQVELQKEIINRQQRQIQMQEQELLHLKQQDYYNQVRQK